MALMGLGASLSAAKSASIKILVIKWMEHVRSVYLDGKNVYAMHVS